jgi:hypothetical protein
MKYQPKNSGGEDKEDGHHGEGGRGGYEKRAPKKYNNLN